jgi:hypothetical protein
MEREHAKCQRLIDCCRTLPAAPTAVAALAAHARRESAGKAVA